LLHYLQIEELITLRSPVDSNQILLLHNPVVGIRN